MELFKPYESKPVTRMAFQITSAPEDEVISYSEASTYYCRGVMFKAYEEPKVGDWIVRLTETDTYHCTDAVFRERNIVPE